MLLNDSEQNALKSLSRLRADLDAERAKREKAEAALAALQLRFDELHDQRHEEARKLDELKLRFDTYVKDSGTTFRPCQDCGHMMSGRECVWCRLQAARAEVERLRAELDGWMHLPSPPAKE